MLTRTREFGLTAFPEISSIFSILVLLSKINQQMLNGDLLWSIDVFLKQNLKNKKILDI